MIKQDRLGMMTIWIKRSHQGDGSRAVGDRLNKHGVRGGGGQMTVYSDNFVDDYHICELNCKCSI